MLAALLAVVALAQNTGSIEGRVTNSLTRAAPAGVAVQAGGERVWTDPDSRPARTSFPSNRKVVFMTGFAAATLVDSVRQALRSSQPG